MEPIYIYILVLSFIAAHLIYDSTIGAWHANIILNELKEKNIQLKSYFEKSIEFQERVLNPDELGAALENFEQLEQTRQDISATTKTTEYLKECFLLEINKLPNHLYKKMFRKLSKFHLLRISEIQQERDSFITALKRYFMKNYNPMNITMVEFTLQFYIYEKIEIIKFDNGNQLSREQVINHLGKCRLNYKLATNLPTKPKAKVNKI